MHAENLIIGGGVTGLSLAYRLASQGKRVMLLEAGELGGVVQTKKIDGFTLELGPNVFLNKPHLMKLLADLKLEDEVVYAPKGYKQFVWYDWHAELVPKSPTAFLKTPLISLYDKLMLPFRGMRPGLLRPKAQDESVRQFLSRGLGRTPVDRIAAPALQGIFGGDLDKLSARSVLPELWRGAVESKSLLGMAFGKEPKRAFVLRNGAASLISALAEKMSGSAEIKAGKVASMLHGPGGDARFEAQLVSGEKITASKVFVATSGEATAGFFKQLDPSFAADVAKMRAAPIVVAHVSVASGALLPANSFGMLFPPGEKSQLLGIMYNSLLFPHVAPKGRDLLTLCFGGIEGAQVMSRSDEEISSAAVEEVIDKLGFTMASALNIQRWPRAIPQYEVGHYQFVKKLREIEAKYQGLKFLGADFGGVGVPDRVRAAFEVEI